jgi:hypothetical protein
MADNAGNGELPTPSRPMHSALVAAGRLPRIERRHQADRQMSLALLKGTHFWSVKPN